MLTLSDYFRNDFSSDTSLDSTLNFQVEGNDFEIIQRIRFDTLNSARLFTYYIAESNITMLLIEFLLKNLQTQINASKEVGVVASFPGDINLGSEFPVYVPRVYFYIERDLTELESKYLESFATNRNLLLTMRGPEYLRVKNEIQKPIGFISHDSRDQKLIAWPLHHGLWLRLCYVWYSEASLKVGDSLRESIQKGIQEAQKCIIVITKNYLTNPGWTKTEFNSIFTREMILNERIVLPIWYGVTPKEVYEYAPTLADTFALTWPSPENKELSEYNTEVEQLISKVHGELTRKN